jgi:hypothetical protein
MGHPEVLFVSGDFRCIHLLVLDFSLYLLFALYLDVKGDWHRWSPFQELVAFWLLAAGQTQESVAQGYFRQGSVVYHLGCLFLLPGLPDL